MAAVGIAAAVGTLLVAVTIADRARTSTIGEIARMGANVLIVDAAASNNVAGRARTGGIVRTLTDADAREIATRVPGVTSVAAEYRGILPMKVGDLARQVAVSGDEAGYGELRGGLVERGRFFSAAEETGTQRVAVLGARVAADLFQGVDPLAVPIRLGGVPFSVIGVLEERGVGVDAFDEDQSVFVPLRTARRRLFNVAYVQRVFLRIGAKADLDDVRAAVRALVAARHPPRAGDSLDFRVQDQRRLIEMREGAADRLRTFQRSVTILMLLAGSGGVFGLQLLAVRERRSEIGVRRALGATRWDVFTQFATEAWATSSVGVLLGLGLGWLGAEITGGALSPALAVFAGSASLASCMVASAAPALKAARVPAARALRLR